MDVSAGSGEREDSGVGRRGLPRQSSGASLSGPSGMSERLSGGTLISSRVNALRAAVNGHADSVAKFILSSKESLEKRTNAESAFRACKDAFLEVSAILMGVLDERTVSSASLSAGEIGRIVAEVLDDHHKKTVHNDRNNCQVGGVGGASQVGSGKKTYSSVVALSGSEVRVSRGPTVQLADTASFLVVPRENMRGKYKSSSITKETLCKILKPADCALKIKKITHARDCGVRIEAHAPDIEKIKAHPAIAGAGLEVRDNIKSNPRIIVHGVPVEISAEEIEKELIAQNLDDDLAKELKVIYIFKPKMDRRSVSCVIELRSAARRALMNRERIFLRYAACTFADHIRVVQCYRCMFFGHIMRDCKNEPSCGHCAGAHEKKECTKKDEPPKCINCVRHNTVNNDIKHSATDAASCLWLGRKIEDKIAYIDYD